jgi:hypothetical protein
VPACSCVGDRYAQAQPWIDHCGERNRALIKRTRAPSENAALTRGLAVLAHECSDTLVGLRLEDEAQEEDRLYGLVKAMVEGLPETAPGHVA